MHTYRTKIRYWYTVVIAQDTLSWYTFSFGTGAQIVHWTAHIASKNGKILCAFTEPMLHRFWTDATGFALHWCPTCPWHNFQGKRYVGHYHACCNKLNWPDACAHMGHPCWLWARTCFGRMFWKASHSILKNTWSNCYATAFPLWILLLFCARGTNIILDLPLCATSLQEF